MASILVVDDNELLRHGIADVLKDADYFVMEASTGREALALLNSALKFDLLITDLVMPDMEGLELITVVRKSHPDLTMVAISGSFDGQFLPVAKRFGVKATLLKPFKRAALLELVASALSSANLPDDPNR